MDIFFDSYQLRKIRVLQTISAEDRSFTIAEIAEKIHTSAVTVDKNIESLIHDLEQIEAKSYIIRLNTPQRAVYLKKHSLFSIKLLKKNYMKTSIALKLLIDIFNNDFVDIRTFSNNNFLSTTIVYRKVNALEEYLKQFQLTWDFSASFELSGKEMNIRYFYFILFWQRYEYQNWSSYVDKKETETFIQLIEKIQGHSLDSIMREYYSVWLVVIAQRIRQESFLEESIANGKELRKVDDQLYDSILGFLANYGKSEMNPRKLQNEVSFIYLIAYSFEYRPDFQERMGAKRFQLIHAFLDGKLTESTIFFIEALEKEMCLKLSIKEYDSLYLNIMNAHLQNYFFPEVFSEITLKGFSYLSDSVEVFFDLFFERILEKLQKNRFLYDVFKNTESLKQQYKFIFSDLLKAEQHLPQIKLTIFSKMGRSRLNYYRRLLALVWLEPISISCEIEEDTDVIISDDFYQPIESYENYLTILWNEEPTSRDLEEIKEVLTTILVEKARAIFCVPET